MSILSNLFGNRQYSIGELMNIDQNRQSRSQGCSVKLVKTYHELKDESILDKFRSHFLGRSVVKSYYVVFKLEVISDTGNKHIVFIRTEPDFDISKYTDNKVKVYCDCSDFKYRSSYVLNKRNSLFLTDKLSSTLGPAITQPPRANHTTTFLCKHAFAAITWLTDNYQSIMSNI